MKRILFVAAALATMTTTLSAQGRARSCPTSTSNLNADYYTADACEKAIDLFNYMAPQLGTAIAGGSAVMGKGGTLGGLGHFSVGFRVNAVNGTLPQIIEGDVRPSTGAPQQDDYTTEKQVVPMPVVDGAVGLFKGIPLGVTNVGGIDLLVNAAYMRDFEGGDIAATVRDGQWKFGYGARIGLLQESLVSPGLAVSYIKRDLPVMNVAGVVENANTSGEPQQYEVSVSDVDVQTTAWRVTASKSLLVFGLMVGGGQDRYKSSATAFGRATGVVLPGGVTSAESAPVDLKQTLTRTNLFAGVTLNMMMFKLAAEIGQVSGGEIETFNTFDKKPDASRLYGSLGLRFGL
jgi:hypothetical protein